jgi:cell division protein ZapB
MAKLDDLAERVDRLVLRHQELKRTSALIEQQLLAVTAERDSLRSRLAAARARIDACWTACPPTPAREPPHERHEADRSLHPGPGLHAGLPARRRNAAARLQWLPWTRK